MTGPSSRRAGDAAKCCGISIFHPRSANLIGNPRDDSPPGANAAARLGAAEAPPFGAAAAGGERDGAGRLEDADRVVEDGPLAVAVAADEDVARVDAGGGLEARRREAPVAVRGVVEGARDRGAAAAPEQPASKV